MVWTGIPVWHLSNQHESASSRCQAGSSLESIENDLLTTRVPTKVTIRDKESWLPTKTNDYQPQNHFVLFPEWHQLPRNFYHPSRLIPHLNYAL